MDAYEYKELVIKLERKSAALEAKCYAYEQIIAKSNFAPFVETQETDFVAEREKET